MVRRSLPRFESKEAQGGSEKQRLLQGSGFVIFCAAAAMCDLEQWQLGCSDPIGAHPLHTLQFGQISVTAFFHTPSLFMI